MGTRRTDAERRVRQSERFSRLLRILQLISGPGRYDAAALATELECSIRTVHRSLQTLTMANVPWYFDAASQAYRIRQGFRLAQLLGTDPASCLPPTPMPSRLRVAAKTLIGELRQFANQLEAFCANAPSDADRAAAATIESASHCPEQTRPRRKRKRQQ